MAVRMLIDAAHPEETRVVVLDGNRLEEFDVETASRRPLKGNIYLAKVTRVEPSLQAAFVEYGGNRHGFIPFAEIHPDYYQIPIADRQALLAAQAAADESEDDEDEQERQDEKDRQAEEARIEAAEAAGQGDAASLEAPNGEPVPERADFVGLATASEPIVPAPGEIGAETDAAAPAAIASPEEPAVPAPPVGSDSVIGTPAADQQQAVVSSDAPTVETSASEAMTEVAAPTEVESVGGEDATEEVRRPRTRHIRSYRIQEVIKRRQILLVQVVKEERGTKGAALTTYISLAGRYCVLMPNSPRGGGVSRKIANPGDRKRLKSIAGDLDVPEGMGVIVRTAGLNRSKPEIKRDYEYLLRLWDSIRELTLRSTAPALVYEEANLIKRTIRDLFHGEIDEILVEGEQGYHFARDFMATLMPSHVGRVKHYTERVPLLQRYQTEQQLDGIHLPQVQLKSGGTIVFGQTEALVAIDVNSGRATRERNIEETATKTNLEAAEEIARQLRLRDLAGLIVIDFIDMEDGSNNRAVERKLKECLKADRARIQVGRISPFGLLEMSRQRLRQSLQEASTNKCPHCQGTGLIRSTDQSALVALRAIEDEAAKDRASEITVAVAPAVALYLLNQKRGELVRIEQAHGMSINVSTDEKLIPPEVKIERSRPRLPGQQPAAAPMPIQHVTHESVRPPELEAEAQDDAGGATTEVADDFVEQTARAPRERSNEDGRSGEDQSFGQDGSRRRRRRRRRGGGGGQFGDQRQGGQSPQRQPRDREVSLNNPPASPLDAAADTSRAAGAPPPQSGPDTDHEQRGGRRRRGRRGGRRNRHGDRPAGTGDQPYVADLSATEIPTAVASDPLPASSPQPAYETPWTEARPEPAPSKPEPLAAEPPVPAPAPQSVETSFTPAPADPAAPRKTGWWRRTFGGG